MLRRRLPHCRGHVSCRRARAVSLESRLRQRARGHHQGSPRGSWRRRTCLRRGAPHPQAPPHRAIREVPPGWVRRRLCNWNRRGLRVVRAAADRAGARAVVHGARDRPAAGSRRRRGRADTVVLGAHDAVARLLHWSRCARARSRRLHYRLFRPNGTMSSFACCCRWARRRRPCTATTRPRFPIRSGSCAASHPRFSRCSFCSRVGCSSGCGAFARGVESQFVRVRSSPPRWSSACPSR